MNSETPKPKPKTLWQWLTLHSSVFRGLENWSKNHSLPGFHRIPLFDIIEFIQDELRREDLMTRSNAIAFSFFLALFPGIIVLFSLVAYLPIYEKLRFWLQEGIHEFMPGSAGQLMSDTIRDVMTIQRSGLLSIGFILAIFFSSNGMMALMKGFEKDHKISFRRRHPLVKRLIAIELTFLMFLLLVGSVVLVILGNTIISFVTDLLSLQAADAWLLSAIRWLAIILLYFFGITLIYRIGGTARKHVPFVSPGSTFATIGSLGSSLVFSSYVDNFANYNKVYGSIGAIIVLLLWLQLNAMILLLGFELNAGIMVNRDMRELKKSKQGT